MMPPIAGCHPQLLESSLLFRRLAGLVVPAKIIVVMTHLRGRPTITRARLILSTPFERADR